MLVDKKECLTIKVTETTAKTEISRRDADQVMPATIRRLLESDRDDVKEISRHIWEGHDYLSEVAEEWLKDPECHFYGLETDGRIVAVGNLRLIEDGQTGWMEGLRVHPEYRGKGFANKITRYLVKEAENLRAHRLRYTTSSENAASLKLADMAGFTRLLQMTVLWITKPRKVPPIQGYGPIEETSPARTYSLLKTNPGMIPHGVLIYSWRTLDNSLRNIEKIGKNHRFYTALKNGKVDSLSIGHPRAEPTQEWQSFTIYAKGADGFLAQLSHNITVAMKVSSGSVMGTFEDRFDKTLDQLDLGSEEQGTTHLVLLEKQI